MENNFDNTPENTGADVNMNHQPQNAEPVTDNGAGANTETQTPYTEPNAGATPQSENPYTYHQPEQGYSNTNYQQKYQDNYNYNVGNNTGYTQEYSAEADNSPISLGEWILIFLLMSIPCVNIILCFVWGFGKQGNITKRNFCRAQLIFMAIGIVFSIVIMVILFMVVGIGASSYYYY